MKKSVEGLIALCAVPIRKSEFKGPGFLGGLGFSQRVKHADMVGPASAIYSRSEAPLPYVNAVNAGLVVGGEKSVSHVFGVRDVSQILYAIVEPVAVNMVKNARLFAGVHLPYYPVGQVSPTGDHAVKIPFPARCAKRWLRRISSVPAGSQIRRLEHCQGPLAPDQETVFGIANQQVVQHRQIRQRFSSHVMSPHVRGQGLAVLQPPFEARFL